MVGVGLPHRGGDDAGLLRQRRRDRADDHRCREGGAAAEGQGEAEAAGQGKGKKARPLPPRKAGADQRYKEFKIVAYYDEEQKHRLVCGTRGDHAVAGRLMRREAARIRLDLADEKVGNVDGSPWIRNEVQRQWLPLDALGLDFYHLKENAQQARREVYGEDDEAGEQWLGDLLHRFKHEGYEGAWQGLVGWRAGLRRGKRKAADRLLNYVSERREMIKYPEFVGKGWQIGSGPTEATCKTLTARLKGSGMRWDADNAEALMALEASRRAGNGRCIGKPSYGQRVEYARKFGRTHVERSRHRLMDMGSAVPDNDGARPRPGLRPCRNSRPLTDERARMLEAANEFEATRTMVDARLGRDERQRREGVPTVSVLAGPETSPPPCWAAGASDMEAAGGTAGRVACP